MADKRPNRKRQGANRIEAGKYFQVDPQTIDDWGKKRWLVRFPDRSIDLESTAVRVDAMRDPFVGGKPDRGVEPKRKLTGACAGEVSASLRGGLRGVGKASGVARKRGAKRRRGDEFLPEDIKSPDIASASSADRGLMIAKTEGAPSIFSDFRSGECRAGINKGQFAAWEILAAALDLTGPADVVVATWSTNGEAIKDLARLRSEGRIKNLRLVLDNSLRSREPEYFQILMSALGNDCIRTTRTHAKWCVLTNDRWNIVIRGSMNFGAVPRLEYFEVSDDRKLAEFLNAIADELFLRAPVWNFEADSAGLAFDSPGIAPIAEATKAIAIESGRLTVDEVAEALHISRNLVTRLRNAGQMKFDDDGCTTIERARDELRTAGRGNAVRQIPASGDPVESTAGDGFVDIIEARRRKEVAEAKIAEMKEAQMRRDLIAVADAVRVYCDVTTKAKVNIEAIPNRCAELLVSKTDVNEIRCILQKYIAEALAVVSGDPPEVS